MEVIEIAKAVAFGAGSAAAAVLVGWWKSREKFDGEKMARTVVFGLILGGLAGGLGLDVDTLQQQPWMVAMMPALVYFVDAAAIAIWKRIKEKLGR